MKIVDPCPLENLGITHKTKGHLMFNLNMTILFASHQKSLKWLSDKQRFWYFTDRQNAGRGGEITPLGFSLLGLTMGMKVIL